MPPYDYSNLAYISSKNNGILFNIKSDSKLFGGASFLLERQIAYDEENWELDKENVKENMKKLRLFSESSGPQPDDVVQIRNGSCYFMGVLRNMAAMNPGAIMRLVTEERDDNNQPTGYAVVHFFAMKDGIKVPYDVKVPMTHCPIDEFVRSTDSVDERKRREAVRWTTVIQKAYFASLLWKTNGKLPTADDFYEVMGSGEEPFYANCQDDIYSLYEGFDPNRFIDFISPVPETDEISPVRIRKQMLNADSIEQATEILSDRLIKAKYHGDVIVFAENNHVVSVEDIVWRNGEAIIQYYDQFGDFGDEISVRHLLTDRKNSSNEEVPFSSLMISNRDNKNKWRSHQVISIGSFEKDFEKNKEVDKPLDYEERQNLFFTELSKTLGTEDIWAQTQDSMFYEYYKSFIVEDKNKMNKNNYPEMIQAIQERILTELPNEISEAIFRDDDDEKDFIKHYKENEEAILNFAKNFYLGYFRNEENKVIESLRDTIIIHLTSLVYEKEVEQEQLPDDNPEVEEDLEEVINNDNDLFVAPEENNIERNINININDLEEQEADNNRDIHLNMRERISLNDLQDEPINDKQKVFGSQESLKGYLADCIHSFEKSGEISSKNSVLSKQLYEKMVDVYNIVKKQNVMENEQKFSGEFKNSYDNLYALAEKYMQYKAFTSINSHAVGKVKAAAVIMDLGAKISGDIRIPKNDPDLKVSSYNYSNKIAEAKRTESLIDWNDEIYVKNNDLNELIKTNKSKSASIRK